jgi:molybdate transport system substrate-binding protein
MKKFILFLFITLSIGLKAQPVKIIAAADLRQAMCELEDLYETQNPGSKLEVSYGSSGNAFTQIMNGADFDLFFSADIQYPKKLKDAGLTLSEPKLYGIGRIVLWSSGLDVSKGLPVLATGKNLKIAVANPEHAPYGQRAIESLKFYSVYESVKDELIYGENISQAAQFCLTGNADAGILALSLALSPAMKDKGKYILIDQKSHQPLEQAYVILNSAKGKKEPFAFAKFIETKVSKAIFEKYGFTLPK